jgi:hypothetical protein
MKTRICRHYLKGWCERGSSCGFAHGTTDLYNSPTISVKKGKQPIGSICPFVSKTHISQDYVVVQKKETKDVYTQTGENDDFTAEFTR